MGAMIRWPWRATGEIQQRQVERVPAAIDALLKLLQMGARQNPPLERPTCTCAGVMCQRANQLVQAARQRCSADRQFCCYAINGHEALLHPSRLSFRTS